MKIALLALVVIGIGIAIMACTKPGVRAPAAAENPGVALRQMFLTMSASDAGTSAPSTQHGVWAAAMDLSFDRGSATIISTINGSASLYTSTGGAIIGGEAHEQVRNAASKFVTAAESCADQMSAGPIQPLPSPGHIRFYAHSRSELLHSPEVSEQDLASGASPLATCYAAAQEVITQLRQVRPDA